MLKLSEQNWFVKCVEIINDKTLDQIIRKKSVSNEAVFLGENMLKLSGRNMFVNCTEIITDKILDIIMFSYFLLIMEIIS